MKLNRKWFLVIALVLSLTMATAGTLAFLTDRDSEANVFTFGNVEIDLDEDFNQGAELMPGVDIEKKPTITNTGKNDAWVWAEIAIPKALNNVESASKNVIHFNMSAASVADGLWNWWDSADYSEGAYMISTKEIEGVSYDVYTIQYETALKPGETTQEPVIYKVYLDTHVDIDPNGDWYLVENGEVTKIDWNIEKDGYPVIYVSAYAMQKDGFDTVYAAYDAYNKQWGDNGGELGTVHGLISNADQAYDSTLESGVFTLTSDIKTSDANKHYNGNREYAVKGVDYTINLNGRTINHDGTYQDGKNTGYTYLYTAAFNGKLTINGEGTINSENTEGSVCIVYAQGPSEVVINGGNFNAERGIPVWAGNGGKVTINGGSFISSGSNDEELIYSSGGVIDIYGGFFHNNGWEGRPVNVANANRGTGFINIYGGTFVNFDPSTGGDDPNNIKVADGCKVVAETQENGDVWYTVIKG